MIPRLWVISPDDGRDLAPALRRFGALGVRGLILRESRPVAPWVAIARDAGFTDIFAHARAPDSDRCGADGRHLRDTDPASPGRWGRSTHSPAAARDALAAGAAYVLLSPIWRPASKPTDARAPLGLAALADAGPGPVLALGGVDPARFATLRANGAYGAAILGRWWDDPDAIAAFTPRS